MITNALMELAACPFCGGEPELQGFQDSEDSIHWSVKCKSCGALSGEAKADSTPDQEFAITSWNTRPQLRTAAAEGGEAVAYLHYVSGEDGEPDQALSFTPDSFPLEGVAGYRKVSCQPLYAHPTTSPKEAEGAVAWVDVNDLRRFVNGTGGPFLHAGVENALRSVPLYLHPPTDSGAGRDGSATTNDDEISSKLVDEKWPARFGCNGPEGSFWTDDAELAHRLIVGAFDRDEWTVTDTEHPYHTAIAGAAGEAG